MKQIIFRKVAGCSSAILNLITFTNFRIRHSILEAHLGLPYHLCWGSLWSFSVWKLITNATKSFILDVTMVLDTTLCFFRKPSNATCFIIHFTMCSQIRALWNCCHVQRERDDKNMKICHFWARGFMSQKYEERVRKF